MPPCHNVLLVLQEVLLFQRAYGTWVKKKKKIKIMVIWTTRLEMSKKRS